MAQILIRSEDGKDLSLEEVMEASRFAGTLDEDGSDSFVSENNRVFFVTRQDWKGVD